MTTCAYTKNGRKAALGGGWESAQLSGGLHGELLPHRPPPRKGFTCGLLTLMADENAEEHTERIQGRVDDGPVTSGNERLMELVARSIGRAYQYGQPERTRS